jgi:transcription elongation GreA/GreB family factor
MSKRKDLRKQIEKKAQETIMKLMADERARPVVAKAMQAFTEGRQRVDRARDQAATQLGIATAAELQATRSQLKKLEKRIKELEDRLASAATSAN